MDITYSFRRIGNFIRVPRRVHKLSQDFSETFRKLHLPVRKVIPWALLLSAIGLGAMASQWSIAEAMDNWNQKHQPVFQIWKRSLDTYGYKNESQAERLQKAVRTLPARTDSSGVIWWDQKRNWIAVYFPQDGTEDAKLFCKKCDISPIGWTTAGRGWGSFEQILSQVEKDWEASRAIGKNRGEFYDPREIRY